MKKRLESELISIAHRILKLKNKSEVDQLYRETQKLYETLTVLKFYGDNYEQLKADVSKEDLQEKIENSLNEKPLKIVSKPKIVAEIPVEENLKQVQIEEVVETIEDEKLEDENLNQVQIEEEVVETIEDEKVEEENLNQVQIKDDLDFEAIFELAAETPVEENLKQVHKDENLNQVQIEKEITFEPVKQEPKQISFEDLLGQNYTEPIFDKPGNVATSISKIVEEVKEDVVNKVEIAKVQVDENLNQVQVVGNLNQVQVDENLNQVQIKTLNEKLSAGINVGLNDRIAFVKNLFADSNEDYNRVISQLNTFDTMQEAQEFIDDMVKPDYNDWSGKEEYQERFMEIIEKKFA
ncbi:hypothetical protein [Flavobacterium sp.]|uniref:hypothetical protein n=1 Tax=Flavobacterium sp. TaxID=239 RepID=UPI00375023AE